MIELNKGSNYQSLLDRITLLESTIEDRVDDISRLRRLNSKLLAELSIYRSNEVTTEYQVLADKGRTIELLKQLGRKEAYMSTREELLDDDTEYCCYCNEVKITFQCCRENHFERFRDMCGEQQLSILENT